MITWIKINQRACLMSYLATKKSDVAYDSLLRLLRRFCQHYGFSRQQQTKNKLKQAVLTEIHDEFTRDFHREYQSYENDCVFNVDETWMYYNLPATYILGCSWRQRQDLNGEEAFDAHDSGPQGVIGRSKSASAIDHEG
ncbi:hypothetical protein DYB36_010196, partial [Aphanomyces astaci]